MTDSKRVDLPARCHCGQLRISSQIPVSALPLPMYFCHCNTCNQVSGTLVAMAVPLPEGSTPLEVQGTATSYKTSDSIERFFCATCGASVWEDASAMGVILIDSGAVDVREVTVDGRPTPVAEPGVHIFVGATKDGGLRDWLAQVPGWEEWPDVSKEVPQGQYYQGNGKGPRGSATGKCHCGGIEIEVRQPPAEGKYPGFLCACNDCRLASGFDITAWWMVPKQNVTHGGSHLRVYNSSEHVKRYFCGRCGAAMLCDVDRKPDTYDVAAGLLHGGLGHRVSNMVEWKTEIGHHNLAQNKPFVDKLGEGLKAWSQES